MSPSSKTIVSLSLFLLWSPLAMQGASFTVTNNNDSGAGSLREAIINSNGNASPSNTITFDSGLGTIVLQSPLTIITKNLTINGPTGSQTIDGASAYQGFYVFSGTTTLTNLVVQNCLAQGGNGGNSSLGGGGGGGGGPGAGGGLYIELTASASTQNVSFLQNMAAGGAGGSCSGFAIVGGGGGGGGNGGDGGSTTGSTSFGGGGGGGGDAGGTAGTIGTFLIGGTGGNGGAGGTGSTPAGGFLGGGAGGGAGFNGLAPGMEDGGLGGGTGGGGGCADNGGAITGGGGAGGNIGGTIGGGGGGGVEVDGGGAGGFGSGGGGGGIPGGGAGGFGGGSGGGGTSAGTGGGGGAGLGGGIFVANGSTLVFQDGALTNNQASAGSAGTGTIAGQAGSAFGQDIFMVTGALVTFDISSSLSISTPIQSDQGRGAGGVTKIGNGTLYLNGTNTYVGTTTLTSGGINLNGSILGDLVGSAGTVFSGNAAVGGSLTTSGAISPGNSMGTITVTNNLVLNSGSETVIEIDPSASSTIAVGDNTTIASGAVLFIDEDIGNYTAGTTYSILTTTTGTISQPFTSIVTENPLFQFQQSFNPAQNILFLTLLNSVNLLGVNTSGLTGNNLIVANYLNSLTNYAPLQTVLVQLAELSGNALSNALETIDPARNAFATFASQNIAFAFSDLVNGRLANRRFLRTLPKETQLAQLFEENDGLIASASETSLPARTHAKKQNRSYSVWIAGFGQLANEKAQKETPEFNMNTGAALLGFEGFGFEHALVGGSLGYARITVDEKGDFGKQWVNDFVASFYSSIYLGNFFLDMTFWGGYNHTTGERHIFFPGFDATAHSKTRSWQATPHLGFGYDFIWSWFGLEPFAQFDWAVNFEDGFQETGAGIFDMKENSRTSSLLRSEAGLAFFQTCEFNNGSLFVAREKFSYVNKKPFHTGRVTAAILGAPGSFTVESLTETQNLFAPGAELFYQWQNGVFASGLFEGEYGDGYISNNVYVKLGYEF